MPLDVQGQEKTDSSAQQRAQSSFLDLFIQALNRLDDATPTGEVMLFTQSNDPNINPPRGTLTDTPRYKVSSDIWVSLS